VGVGGIGINAIQGARMAGAGRIFAIDPVDFKCQTAREFGATHTAPSMSAALELIHEVTWGRMCHQVIMAMSVGRGELMSDAIALAGKNGRIVITNVHPWGEKSISIRPLEVQTLEKQIVGCLFGSCSPRRDIPYLLELHSRGQLKLNELITRRYTLEELNSGYDDMRNGRIIRGILDLA
jgi:Zn-dependent alcohol dehydrogenase